MVGHSAAGSRGGADADAASSLLDGGRKATLKGRREHQPPPPDQQAPDQQDQSHLVTVRALDDLLPWSSERGELDVRLMKLDVRVQRPSRPPLAPPLASPSKPLSRLCRSLF